MARLIAAFAVLVLAAAGAGAQAACPAEGRGWCPATYRGLALGRATVDDALRVLGEPRAILRPEAGEEMLWMGFDVAGDLPGRANVWADARTGVLERIVIHPRGVTRAAALRLFGEGYVVTRYAPDECAEGDLVPLYESPAGPVEQLEYRARGIALSFTGEGQLHEVLYLSAPLGEPRSSCAGRAVPGNRSAES